ncbi:cytochrome P450 6k1-like [Phymastichus coffea]|uniref:cytochrome P450 6k1-like n=1 Tax=Phymastichus coffea TaxID=108790 RepID=UPI00273AF571|nr:cytochrome P450 6k1-like [Phymastichus coffea]
MDLLCLALVLATAAISYWYCKRLHSYWDNQHVPSIANPNVIFGHMLPAIAVKENIAEFVGRAYKSFDSSMVGFYFLRRPGILVRDPEIVKRVLQTDFPSFHANLVTLSERNDPVLVNNPFFVSDHELWKKRRTRISNNLTGKKLKCLFAINQEVCNGLSAFVERKIRENGQFYECELKNHFTRCTGEVVANAALAIDGQSFRDQPDRLAFTVIAKSLFEPTFVNGIKQALLFFLPGLANLLGLAFLEKKTDDYMRQTIKAIIKQRQQAGEAPNDYLQFSAEANSLDIDGIVGDVVNFYADVYETSSSAMANLFYNLSQNPEIQSKLRDHLASVLRETDGQVTPESLKSMTYLDQVISESMRVIPAAGTLIKCCTKEITLTGADGVSCHLVPGNPVFIPIIGLHRDEKYWPNPEVFDPDRFSPENQIHINKYAYLPFGEGPRMCVGMRFALMLIKQTTATLITKFAVEHSPKTKVPLEIDPSSFLIAFKAGLWARFKNI